MDSRLAAAGVRLDGDPVAHGWIVASGRGVMPKAPGDTRQPFTIRREDPVNMRVFQAHACREESSFRVRREGLFEPGIPTQSPQVHRHGVTLQCKVNGDRLRCFD